MRVLPAYMNMYHMCAQCVFGTSAGQRKTLDSLELELQVVVSQYVGARNYIPGPLQEQQILNPPTTPIGKQK